MMWRPRTLLLLSTVLMATACGPDPEALTPSSTTQSTLDGKLAVEQPTIMLLVVDDADTADAAQLRGRVSQSVRAGLLDVVQERWGLCGSPDPAAWHPGAIRVVVARPSAPDDAALLTPIDIPALAWITQTSKADEVDAVMEGVTKALGQRRAAPGEAYRPLRAAKRALELATGGRAPVSNAEKDFAASLPKDRRIQVVVASARDDGDATAVYQLMPSMGADPTDVQFSVIVPFKSVDETCAVIGASNTRLEAWGRQARANLVAWPCNAETTWDGLLSPGVADCRPVCQSKPIVVSPGGAAECQILIDQTDLDSCDPGHGWRDPGGQAVFVDRFGEKLRRCEAVQLTGADLEGCRHSLDCPGCASGWCVTEVPELASPGQCGGNYVWPIRYVGGAQAAHGGWMNITCQSALEK